MHTHKHYKTVYHVIIITATAYKLTSDFTVLASSNVTDFSSSGVNIPEDPNKGTAPAGSFFLLVLNTKNKHNITIICS